MSIVIDNIGVLVTNDPELGEGPLGVVRDASVVITDDIVESIGPSGQPADEQVDARGGCVLPGFVDSHTHLVFAGDRAEEFTSRMAGRPFAARVENGAGSSSSPQIMSSSASFWRSASVRPSRPP